MRLLQVASAILVTAQAHDLTKCPYANLPTEVAGIRVWDKALCSSTSLAGPYSACVVDRTCAQLRTTTAFQGYQAVGDMSKSNETVVLIMSREHDTIDLSQTVLPHTTTTINFAGIANLSLPLTFQWPQSVEDMRFWDIVNVKALPPWPSTVRQMTFYNVTNASLPRAFPPLLETLLFVRVANVTLPLTFPPTLTSLSLQDATLQIGAMSILPDALRELVITNCSPFPALKMGKSLSRLSLDNTGITDITLGSVTDLYEYPRIDDLSSHRTLKNNENLTRVSTRQADQPLTRVYMENMTIKIWIMDEETYINLQKIASPRNFSHTTISVDASECLRKKGAIRELFNRDTHDERIFTVCVMSEGLSEEMIGNIVVASVAVVILAGSVLFVRRKRQRKHTTTPMLQSQRDRMPELHMDQEYTRKFALWSDDSLELSQERPSPSAPCPSWSFSPDESIMVQPSALMLSSSMAIKGIHGADAAKQDSEASLEANAAPLFAPAMALPPTTQIESGLKLSYETESIEEHRRPSNCIVCLKGPQDAACIPCGHNALCITCAKHLLKQMERSCPVCHQQIREVMRIYPG
ncbi:Aste57867_2488 [Aphanomyces stellatus]|uniref:Aste57867_2488 protein n=1 Tax=Aphanomyces stellatus TaxID=120398 RepID=A0A485KCV5_9STRA|nr:hypothetical protein As57867_002481 [Aphanomyces stellatus]VFT79687.1 Aste57867_2488 [Aphanomyces stellatus]